jgi:hypothetical protein
LISRCKAQEQTKKNCRDGMAASARRGVCSREQASEIAEEELDETLLKPQLEKKRDKATNLIQDTPHDKIRTADHA